MECSLLGEEEQSHWAGTDIVQIMLDGIYKSYYYMAVSQKDWKQTNPRIWLAKIDLDRGLDFPI